MINRTLTTFAMIDGIVSSLFHSEAFTITNNENIENLAFTIFFITLCLQCFQYYELRLNESKKR